MPRGKFTLEQRQAAAERMRVVWSKRKAQAQGYQEAPIVGVSPHSTEQQMEPPPTVSVVIADGIDSADEWERLPFSAALDKLMKLEKDVFHARAVLSKRSADLPRVWTCWTALNRKAHSNLPGMTSTYAKCFKNIPDGKWVFKDDCNINKDTGMVEPVVCCSSDCYMLYQVYKSRARTREREEAASV